MKDASAFPDRSSTPTFYPLCLNVVNRPCIVVGGGNVAQRKVESLLEARACVTVISPDLALELQRWRDESRLHHLPRPYQEGDLVEAFLAIAATDDQKINRAVAVEARRRKVLVNVVDDPAHCDFTLPSVIRRGDLLVAVSTGGRSPALARYVREKLEALLVPEYVALLEVAAGVRAELLARGQRIPGERWQEALDDGLLAYVGSGDLELARAHLISRLTELNDSHGKGALQK